MKCDKDAQIWSHVHDNKEHIERTHNWNALTLASKMTLQLYHLQVPVHFALTITLSKPAWKQQVFGATSSWVSRWLVANNITLCWVIQSHVKSESVNIQLLKQISRKKEMLCKPVHKISSVLYSILFSKLENLPSLIVRK